MSEFKACFCDGSCQKSGICGGDRNMFIGPGLVEKHTRHKTMFKESINKAEEMAQLAIKVRQEKEQKAKELVADFYNKLLEDIERESFKGSRLLERFIPRDLNVDVVVKCLREDGFGVINDSAYEIEITW